ncbi:MAG: protein-glutamate O-methyltransferase CheR, partial [Dehalococcoidales bacterium]|nr:protein-glutamate O-methyltransferase CheR [Dehalococcoidales bacterium]
LSITGAKTYLDYIKYLDTYPAEYQKLTDDFTIQVSSFFRNPNTFQQVASLILPELVNFKENQNKYDLRFWSAGCAHGEEPYSISIMLMEFLGELQHNFDISIYATDINQTALQEAKSGLCPVKNIDDNLNSIIIKKYFTYHGKDYAVNNDIRQKVLFSYFDLTSKFQFLTEVDCIFCCNVLIYLQPQLQQKVIGKLYDSLATPGYLILGEVETLPGNFNDKLRCLDKRAKIYKKE